MKYAKFEGMTFFKAISTEKKARSFAWKTKFEGKSFVCPKCGHSRFWEFECEPEIRKCRKCETHVRLRVGTMFENSKISMLTWLRAIYFVMSSKRGISALELQRRLEIKQYVTALKILRTIRHALMERDAKYTLKDTIELEGTTFCANASGAKKVLVAIETKQWVDDRGRRKTKAGFAKVLVEDELTEEIATEFVAETILPGAKIETNSDIPAPKVRGVKPRRFKSAQEKFDGLPWVYRFISNAKVWIAGTHHGVDQKFLHLYLAEFAFRFNRRHDPDSLFHRALYAMMLANHKASAQSEFELNQGRRSA